MFRDLARPTGFEPVTPGLEGRCSIRMSYGRIRSRIVGGRGGGIRTPDILLPKQARYQTALHPAFIELYARPLIATWIRPAREEEIPRAWPADPGGPFWTGARGPCHRP